MTSAVLIPALLFGTYAAASLTGLAVEFLTNHRARTIWTLVTPPLAGNAKLPHCVGREIDLPVKARVRVAVVDRHDDAAA